MELQSEENGEKFSIDTTTTTLGRSYVSPDSSVSRCHVSLTLTPESMINFEVVGKNPILVLTNGCKRVCRHGEKGELREGDRLSLSIQRPSFWVVKREEVESSILEAVKRREKRTMERMREREEREDEGLREEVGVQEEFGLESEVQNLDLSSLDPVEEFGFLVMGHEFDKYPKGKIQPMKNWNWYLDTPKENSDSENEEVGRTDKPSTSKSKSNSSRKKRCKDGEDEDWTGESDEDKDLIAKNESSLKRSKYSTRSKNVKKSRKESVKDGNASMVQNEEVDDEDSGEVDDEDDETLGGFIVIDDEEEMNNSEEEEEEEFEDEESED